jgi:two-component system, OmpR family, sensor kinase
MDAARVVLTRNEREFFEEASRGLRDPLTICRGYLELVGDDPEEQRETVALVMAELDRMGKIVDQLSVLAEFEEPDFLRPEWIDLELFAHELVAGASALGQRQWTLDHAGDGAALADRRRLTDAVMNLAHNAVQYTVADDTIAIGTSLDEDEARIWVRDTGSGISESDQAHIFNVFTRGRDAHRRYRGGGLGLAIVNAIVEAHGGRVELESRLGEGSTFTIVLTRP